jgi:hypothetical protein
LLDADEGAVSGASFWRARESGWSGGGVKEEKGSSDKTEKGHAMMATGAGAKRKLCLRELHGLLFKSPPLNSGRSLQHAPLPAM